MKEPEAVEEADNTMLIGNQADHVPILEIGMIRIFHRLQTGIISDGFILQEIATNTHLPQSTRMRIHQTFPCDSARKGDFDGRAKRVRIGLDLHML